MSTGSAIYNKSRQKGRSDASRKYYLINFTFNINMFNRVFHGGKSTLPFWCRARGEHKTKISLIRQHAILCHICDFMQNPPCPTEARFHFVRPAWDQTKSARPDPIWKMLSPTRQPASLNLSVAATAYFSVLLWKLQAKIWCRLFHYHLTYYIDQLTWCWVAP